MELHAVFFQGKYRRNKVGNFFLRAFSVSKSIGNNIFLLSTDLSTEKITDEAFPSVILLVN